jgi:hypothetical protein
MSKLGKITYILRMNLMGEFRIADTEGETLRMAVVGETLRFQYHQGTRLWRATARAERRRGKSLRN